MDPSVSHTGEGGGSPAAAMEEDHGCLSAFIDTGSVESHRLYLARRTALEMLRDRGYGVSVTAIEQTLTEFRTVYGDNSELENLKIESFLIRDPSKKILVIFLGSNPVKLSTVRDISSQFGKQNLSRMILILQSNLSSKARENMKLLFPFKVETFHITELLINVTKHVLLPKHEPLSAKEKAKLLKKYNIEDTQLPRILESDAIARYYGFEKGMVLKITYDSELTREHVTYRCVM